MYFVAPEVHSMNVYVSERLKTMKLVWNEPEEPNGLIEEYYIDLKFDDAIIFNNTVSRILNLKKSFSAIDLH